jgi:hypothetical protein
MDSNPDRGCFAMRCDHWPVREIRFVRLKEFGPDQVFTEQFRLTLVSVEASLNFWWDEAVEDYWIGEVEPCGCAD